MNMFDMEQYDENESENGFEDFSNNEDNDLNDLTEEEKMLDNLLNESLDTINLIKER